MNNEPKKKPYALQCKPGNHHGVFWAEDCGLTSFFENGVLPTDDLMLLVTELDRRFIQLWDKINWENKNGNTGAHHTKTRTD